jgi:hypothetical protein
MSKKQAGGSGSYTLRKEQTTMEGLPTKAPELVPDSVRYRELIARYSGKPKRAPPGQLVIGGIGLAGASPEAVRLSDPRRQMGLFAATAAAPAAPAAPPPAEPLPGSDEPLFAQSAAKGGPRSSKRRGGQ